MSHQPPRHTIIDQCGSYEFIPVWRLNNTAAGPPHPHIPSSHSAHDTPTSALNSLLSIPKFIASHIRSSVDAASETPPPLPPKDLVTAPTPTTTPYTWAVPETSAILTAFLSLIYPRGAFTSSPEAPLVNLELTGRVVRAALGYQSAKALNAARDRMAAFVDSHPLETYAMASFFKFTDLARLASTKAMRTLPEQWGPEIRQLMGKSAAGRLEALQSSRLVGLAGILAKAPHADEHSVSCAGRGMMEALWKAKVEQVFATLAPGSELLELLEVDLRGTHCGDCLVLLGSTIRECMYQARELPRSI